MAGALRQPGSQNYSTLPGTSSALAIVALPLGSGACTAPADADTDAESGELRAPSASDVDELLLDDVAADESPPEALAAVKAWSVRHVQLRDPNDPSRPDPVDPFNGFFVVAKDANGAPLFLDAMALTDEGVAHFYFSVRTDEAGKYIELPLLAAPRDQPAAARVERNVNWLASEQKRLGMLIKSSVAADAFTASLAPRAAHPWMAALKCTADLAVLALTATNPIAMLAAQAAVDGTFALVDAVAGNDAAAASEATGAAVQATMATVALGVGKAVSHAVSLGLVSNKTVGTGKAVGGAGLVVAMVGAVGYQTYAHGAKAGLKTALDVLVPQSCQETYANLTDVPHNDVTPPRTN
jgi:hypothetical protein